jgi:hypothetical protein
MYYCIIIDDMNAAESINLKEKLINNPEQNPLRPLNFHERTQHILPQNESTVQLLPDDINFYAEDHQMKLNHEKTKVILFNNARTYDFTPNLSIQNGGPLEVVEQVRLSVQLRSDLSWRSNTSAICQKFDKQIRCIAEFASPVWTAGLTADENNQIE